MLRSLAEVRGEQPLFGMEPSSWLLHAALAATISPT